MARRMPQASSSLKALTITRPRQGRTRHMLGRERPPLYAPCLDRSERSSPLLHPPSKQDLPASVPALVGADQHHLSGLGLPTTLPEGSFLSGVLHSYNKPPCSREFDTWAACRTKCRLRSLRGLRRDFFLDFSPRIPANVDPVRQRKTPRLLAEPGCLVQSN